MFYAEPNALLQRVESALGQSSGLYRKGYDLQRHELRLWFHFPMVARERYREVLQQTLEGTGWTYSVNEKPHQARLAEVAVECLPPGTVPVRAPALRLEDETIVVTLDEPLSTEMREQTATHFKERTGYTLSIDAPGAPAAPERSALDSSIAEPGDSEPVEINQAYRMIEDAFSDVEEPWRPYRKGIKSEGDRTFIELAFITPQVGLRQRDRIAQLAKRIGRHLRIKPEPNQIMLIEVATRIVPKEWRLQKQPSVHRSEGLVRLKCLNAPPEEDSQWASVREQFQEQTGYRLEK